MNKFLLSFSWIILSSSLIKCSYTYEEITPKDEEMGEWEGNYIYRGNIRCKTTGEEENKLIEEITLNDISYPINYVNDYFYKEDHIFMLLESRSSQPELKHSFFVDYSIQDKDYTIIYSMSDEFATMLTFYTFDDEDYAFIRIDKSFSSLIKYSFTTKQIDLTNGDLLDLYDYTFLNDILIVYKDNMMKYTYCDSINLIDIKPIDYSLAHEFRFSIVDDNFLTIKYPVDEQYNSSLNSYINYNALEIYDLNKKKLSTVFDKKDQIELKYLNNYYFIKGSTTSYEYVSSLRNQQTHKYERLTENLFTHNTLYKIDYENASYCEVYKFEDEDIDFSKGFIKDNKYYINASYIKEGWSLNPGGYEFKQYILDLSTLKLRKKSFNNQMNETESTSNYNVIVYGDYQYYITTGRYGSILGGHQAYYLKRKNIISGEEKVMQFFAESWDELIGTRFSNLLWENDRDFSNEKIYITNK